MLHEKSFAMKFHHDSWNLEPLSYSSSHPCIGNGKEKCKSCDKQAMSSQLLSLGNNIDHVSMSKTQCIATELILAGQTWPFLQVQTHMANPVCTCKLLHCPRPIRDMNDCLRRKENMRLNEKKDPLPRYGCTVDRNPLAMFCKVKLSRTKIFG